MHLNQKDIQLLSKNSNLSKSQIDELLKQNVFAKPKDWFLFLKYFSLSIGLGFLSIGILFFFAYNWQDLSKFFKLGLLEFLVLLTFSLSIFFYSKKILSNLLLTVTTLLVGVLFAVFGQIYQTGANAFDFFFGWTLAVFLWVAVTKFEPLWVVFIALVNITFIMFSAQVATDWNNATYYLVLLLINLLFLGITYYFKKSISVSSWFLYLLGSYLILISTFAIIDGIINHTNATYIAVVLLVAVFYVTMLKVSISEKSTFYIASIAASCIAIMDALILKNGTNAFEFLVASIFTIVAVTATIKLILFLQKKWLNE